MKIAIYQMDSIAGDFEGNANKIMAAAKTAYENGADILITPAFSLSGYDLGKLTNHNSIKQQIHEQVERLRRVKGIFIVFGTIEQIRKKIINRLFWIGARQVEILPIHELGDDLGCYIKFRDERLYKSYIYFDYSPFSRTRHADIQEKLKDKKILPRTSILCVRSSGGQDSAVFEGSSFALNNKNEITFQAAFNQETIEYIEFERKLFSGNVATRPETEEELLYTMAVSGLKNYVEKNGFKKLCLGLSGGLDSALVLSMAVDAVGAENCEVLLMPSIYTAEISNTAAEKMAKNLGVRYESVPIWDIYKSFKTALNNRFNNLPSDTTEENLQARIRGTILMALSNKTGALLLATGNKSELAMGYATLYGDMNGGFAPIKDLYKTQVFAIARWLNKHRNQEVIPQEIIDRKPSAELRPNQTDQDSLPEYEVLDKMLHNILEKNATVQELIAQGFDETEVRQTFDRLYKSEYKRKQGAIGTRLSNSLFGYDWVIPQTQRFDPNMSDKEWL